MIVDTPNHKDVFAAIGRWIRLPIGLLRFAKLRLEESFVSIPTNLITNEYAFSFGDSGWHYFRDILAVYEQNPKMTMCDSTFFHFFQHERIRSVRYLNDLLFLHDANGRSQSNAYDFYLGTYPWGEWDKIDDKTGGVAWGHHHDHVEGKMTRDLHGYRRNPWHQPGNDYPLEIEWNQTIHVHHSMKLGYRPAFYGSYPEVVLLVRRDGEMRAVVSQGQHRVSSLSHLGRTKLVVMVKRDSMKTIHEDDVQDWYYVRNGLCTQEQALRIFNAFFELDGRERVKYLELSTSY